MCMVYVQWLHHYPKFQFFMKAPVIPEGSKGKSSLGIWVPSPSPPHDSHAAPECPSGGPPFCQILPHAFCPLLPHVQLGPQPANRHSQTFRWGLTVKILWGGLVRYCATAAERQDWTSRWWKVSDLVKALSTRENGKLVILSLLKIIMYISCCRVAFWHTTTAKIFAIISFPLFIQILQILGSGIYYFNCGWEIV